MFPIFFILAKSQKCCRTISSLPFYSYGLLAQCLWFKAFIQSDLHIVIITNGKLNIPYVQPIESSVKDSSTGSGEVGTKTKTQHHICMTFFANIFY